MSESDAIALVARYFAAFNMRDWQGAADCVSDDVAHDLPGGAREIGRDKLRLHLAQRARLADETAADIAVMIAPGGGRAAAEFTLRGSVKADGEIVRQTLRAGAFFEIDDGRITRLTEYLAPATPG